MCNTLADTRGDISSDVGYNTVKSQVEALGFLEIIKK